ncbi:MAG: UDP-N-acetylmuramoyl-tripeptide--D-alanyl-D-alanine ligase [Bacteroidales bacterium]|jgi:UDP-N-acetylmuramoyl-tripeptide--D-alanyl-D-alanine ligase|nr:UDP-N-acetylmuramoyl-tripeptide--D-alanyl-D-alanine ligase [Bacteroidales bacterium]
MKTDIVYKILEENNFKLTTDSRRVADGELFFALKGEKFNGNEFAAAALERGAVAAVIDDPAYESSATIVVDDVTKTLQAVAIKYRESFDIPVLAITGSNGKTTTKEMLARVLSDNYKVHYTRGNLNNHIGVPLTLLACPRDAGFMIVEMGANHKGEIRELCRMAKPGFGLVTNIGRAHLEGFTSLEGVVEAKSELYDYLESSGGWVFYNEENELLKSILAQRKIDKIPYKRPGKHSLSEIKTEHDPTLELLAEIDGIKYTFRTNLFGEYNLENLLACLSVGLYFDIRPPAIKQAIEDYEPDNNRSQVLKTGSNTLICDSYNANPDSMKGAIKAFRQYRGDNKVIILGDMLELGQYELKEHKKILEELASLRDYIKVIVVGRIFSALAPSYSLLSFETRVQLEEYLADEPIRDSLVLVKASRALGLEKIYDML